MTEESLKTVPDKGSIAKESEQEELMQIMVSGETFVLPVHDVTAVMRSVEITPVPMAPDHMLGVVNVRGQIVCIVDAGKVFHLKSERGVHTESTRFLILRHSRMHLGIWVDKVSDLYRVAKDTLAEIDTDTSGYIRAEITLEGEVFKLLNTRVLFD